METIVEELKENGVDDSNIIYLDLDRREDKRIKTADQLESVVEEKGAVEGLKYLLMKYKTYRILRKY